jgi:hypothetical protein
VFYLNGHSGRGHLRLGAYAQGYCAAVMSIKVPAETC